MCKQVEVFMLFPLNVMCNIKSRVSKSRSLLPNTKCRRIVVVIVDPIWDNKQRTLGLGKRLWLRYETLLYCTALMYIKHSTVQCAEYINWSEVKWGHYETKEVSHMKQINMFPRVIITMLIYILTKTCILGSLLERKNILLLIYCHK